MTEIAPFAPIRVSLEFAFTDGNQVAQAQYDFPLGTLPDADDVAKAAATTLAQVRQSLGDEFRWQTRHEFVSDEFAARTGGVRLAIPGVDQWQAEWAA